jgi:hypothetical protein
MDANHEERKNILKSRDDSKPISFMKMDEETFELCDGSRCSWVDKKEFNSQDLRHRIEPWLTSLFQSEHFSLLVGSGLTRAVHYLAKPESEARGMQKAKFNEFTKEIDKASSQSAKVSERDEGNFEDQIRVANELLTGLRHYCCIENNDKELGQLESRIRTLETDIADSLRSFAESILKDEADIARAESENREAAFEYLVSFLMSFASRSGTRDRLRIFTTNYDRVIESGAEMAGLYLLDRFVGSVTPVFRSSRLNIDMHYNPPGIRGEPRYLEGVANFTKLHGSIDWVDNNRAIRRVGLPFGADSIEPYLKAPGLAGMSAWSLMIYPNSAKDRETAAYPYVDLFRDLASAVCRPNSTLVTYGYSFGDEHINRVIKDMLTIPSTHLVVISRDPLGRIMKICNERLAQTTIMLGKHLGDLKVLVDHYLPKPAIDRTTLRMSELLQARWGTKKPQDKEADGQDGGE